MTKDNSSFYYDIVTVREIRQMFRLFHYRRLSYSDLGKLYTISKQRARVIIKDQTPPNYLLPGFLLDEKICWMCESEGDTTIHYIDGNVENTKPRNLIPLCELCVKIIEKKKNKT